MRLATFVFRLGHCWCWRPANSNYTLAAGRLKLRQSVYICLPVQRSIVKLETMFVGGPGWKEIRRRLPGPQSVMYACATIPTTVDDALIT